MQRVNARHPWSHNDHFHSWMVANLPDPCGSALDVGCGQGELLACLAARVERVIGNDIDPEMVNQSVKRCIGLPNVTVVSGRWTSVAGPFDVVTMIAVLHHLEVEEALREVTRLLAPGGRFLAVGLAVPHSFRDHLWDGASIITNPIIGYVKHPWPSRAGTQPPPFSVRDPTISLDELRTILGRVMPGSIVRNHVGFRHTPSPGQSTNAYRQVCTGSAYGRSRLSSPEGGAIVLLAVGSTLGSGTAKSVTSRRFARHISSRGGVIRGAGW